MAGDLRDRHPGQDHIAEDLEPAPGIDLLHGRAKDGARARKEGGLILAAVMPGEAVGDLLEAEDAGIAQGFCRRDNAAEIDAAISA